MTSKEFNEKEKELLDTIPFEFRSTLSYMAYERSHSSGYDEVFDTLQSLVSDLTSAINSFADRLKKDFEENKELRLR